MKTNVNNLVNFVCSVLKASPKKFITSAIFPYSNDLFSIPKYQQMNSFIYIIMRTLRSIFD